MSFLLDVRPPSLPNPPSLRTTQREQTCAFVWRVCVRSGGVRWAGSSGRVTDGGGGFEGWERGRGGVLCQGVRLRGPEQGRREGKVAMFSGSCEQKYPAIVHSLLYLPRPSLPPVSLFKGERMKMSCVCPQPSLPLPFPPPTQDSVLLLLSPPTHVQLSYKEVSTQ